jgi:hypothetical protein
MLDMELTLIESPSQVSWNFHIKLLSCQLQKFISSKLWKAITLVLFNQLLAETSVQMCYCRSIEQGLHIDQVAQRMVGYSRQQVK